MTTVIRLRTIGRLVIFAFFIQSITTVDTGKDDKVTPTGVESTDVNNQTVIIDEPKVSSNEPVGSDSISSTKPPIELSPTIESSATTNENKSETTQDVPTTTITPFLIDENDTLSTTTTKTTKKNFSHINSFEEWKRQQLLADNSKQKENTGDGNEILSSDHSQTVPLKGAGVLSNVNQIPPNTNGNSGKKGKLRKNFASASCGAKILAHNAEAQNTGSILSSSPDEYMLNPCNTKIWFVIELCESIRILNIEIANFELFSSVPKTFRVSASDRYPTKDWHRHQLGTFNMSYTRVLQNFQLTEVSTYVKYLKFELLDFHGHEHYCPLSIVRVHGSNVEDEITIMEEKTNPIEFQSSSQHLDDVDNDDDESANQPKDSQVGGIIGSAIIDLAKRVFRRQPARDMPSSNTLPITASNSLKNDCSQSLLINPINSSRLRSWRKSDSFKRCIARFLRGLWSRLDSCTEYLSQICFLTNYCCQCPLKSKITNSKRTTTNIYRHYCGYYHLFVNHLVCRKEQQTRANETLVQRINPVTPEIVAELTEKNATVNENNTINQNNASLLNSTLTTANEQPVTINETLSNEFVSMNSTLNETNPLSSSNATHSNSSRTTADSESTKIESIVTETSSELPSSTNENPSAMPNSLNQQDTFQPPPYPQWLKGMLINTKSLPELFKIIEKLNFNLTLSNRYLQELSEHYVKKLDETQQTTDLLLKASQEAEIKFKHYEDQLLKLQQRLDEVSFRLIKLEVWIPLMILGIAISIITSIWSRIRLIQFQRQLDVLKLMTAKSTDEDDDDDDDKHDEHNEANDEEQEQIEPVKINGISKRRSSTDSTDSNVSKSQRVPTIPLSKIRENGNHSKNTVRRRSSQQNGHLPNLTNGTI